MYPGGGTNAYEDGAILVPYYNTVEGGTSWQTAFEATYNGTSPPESGYSSPTYFSNASTFSGYTIYQGWVALRLEQISTAFKTAFGETGINATAAASRVRPVFEWQYGGSWSGELNAMQALFPSQPVDYYLYGGGGGWYSDDTDSGFNDANFANCNFATPTVSGYQADPAGAGWTFNNGSISGSTAGIAANGSSLGNPTAPTEGPPITVGGDNSAGGSTQTAYLQPGASISESVDFSGGWADITLLACQTLAASYSHGLTISIDGTRCGRVRRRHALFGRRHGGAWTWSRTAAFNVTAGYHTVTFTNTWTSGGATVFLDDVAIQTVNGLFSQTAAGGAPAITSVKADVALCLEYGLYDVGYEGGFDFNQNLDTGDANGYSEMGAKGYSSGTPNVGEMANLDPRTEALAVATLDEFYSYGGTLPIEFESSGNDNSWAIAAPNYFDDGTPKQQAVASVAASLPPSPAVGTTVPATLVPLLKSKDYDDSSGALQTGGWIEWDIVVPVTGSYVFTAATTSGGNYSLSIDDAVVLGSGASGGTIDPSVTLTPGVYAFQVEASSGSFSVSQVVVSMAGAPAAPAITGSSLSGGTATLAWSAVSGATGYIIGYGNSSGQYTTFTDVGNTTGGSVSGLNPTAVDYFAVYAYNASAARSLPSAAARLAPRSSAASAYVNFADQAVSDNVNNPVAEPLVESGFAFTSFGNSGGSGLLVVDSGNGYYALPSKGLDAEYWGTSQRIVRTDGSAFDLYSLQLYEFQADSAVITGYNVSGGMVTQVVNLSASDSYASAVQVLDWTDVVKVEITWWAGPNGSGGGRNGAIDDVAFNDLPPTISNVSATPATVTGTSTVLSATAAGHNPAVNPASGLLYTWAATTLPAGAAAPTFTNNNSNAAQNTTAHFSAAGSYVFTVTVTDGCDLVATQTVAVTVLPTASGVTVTPAAPTVADGGTKQLAAVVGDQFGGAMGTQPGFTWSIAGGLGTVSSSGLFTAPSSGSGWTYVKVSGGGYTGSGAVYYTSTVPPNYRNGFTSGSLTFAGHGALSNGDLCLTNSGSSDGAAWYSAKLSTTSFVSDFVFQISTVAGDYAGGMGGDGITFTIQNDAGNAVGSDATGLGCQGITNSVALKFDLVPWDSNWTSNVGAGNEELDSVGVFTGGAAPTTPASDLSMTGVQLRSGNVFAAHVIYDGTTLTVTLTDMTAVQHWSATESYAVNIPAAVGGNTAWFGFTGGSGGNVPAASFENILSWSYAQMSVAAAPAAVTAATSQLSVQGQGTAKAISYTWSASTPPAGAAAPTFSVNGTGAAQNTTATFYAVGTYVLTVTMTDAAGNATADSVTVVVDRTPTAVVVAPSSVNLTGGAQQSFQATLDDQFGDAIPGAAFTWALSGAGTVDANGNYTASAVGTATLAATSGGLNAMATIDVIAPLPAAPASLTATVISGSEEIDLSWPSVAWATAYNVYRGTASGGESATPLNASPLTAASYDDTSVNGSTTYYYVVQAVNATGVGARSAEVSGTTPAPQVAFSDLDVGAPRQAGSLQYTAAGDIYTVSGGGADIWGYSDSFNFASVPLQGDGAILAEVTSVQYTHPAAKAGVMFRDSTAANAAMAMLAVTPGSGLYFETRTTDGGLTTVQFAPGFTTPIWLKLSRAGNLFTACYSTENDPSDTSWIAVGSPVAISSFSTAAQVGLAVTAHNGSALNVSTFTGVSVSSTDNSGSTAQMAVTSGAQTMSAPLVMAANLSIVPPAGTTLTISGNIGEASRGTALSLIGPGAGPQRHEQL